MTELPSTPPFKIKMVEPIRCISKEERVKAIERAGNNIFLLKAEEVFIDLLTDSGTGAMSDRQWAALMMGDESYAGSRSFFSLQKTVQEVMGFPYTIPTHQGRGAEKILDGTIVQKGNIVPGNYHFDTTMAHIEHQGGFGVNCVVEEAFDPSKILPFKGNMDLKKLDGLIREQGAKNIPYILHTITCNSVGGQPVSMQNIRETSTLAKNNAILFFLDAARFAENAHFIQKRENGYSTKSIREIVHEMMSYADGCLMSAKKDGIVNIGGFIAVRDKELYQKILPMEILMEGFPHYGGMAGRDLEALAIGLRESTDEAYLNSRIGQINYLAEKLDENGIPIVKPVGGHAVFVDAKAFLPHIPQEQFPAMALCAELYTESGVRAVEIGTVLAGRNPQTNENVMPPLDLVRLTIPRRVYLREHMDYVAAAFQRLAERKNGIKGIEFEYEAPVLRHFQSTFKKVEKPIQISSKPTISTKN